MPTNEKKGITVKIDAELHVEVRQYLEQHGMTMADFITMALQDELHPKFEQKEENSMEKMRTLAFQVPEDLFQQIRRPDRAFYSILSPLRSSRNLRCRRLQALFLQGHTESLVRMI